MTKVKTRQDYEAEIIKKAWEDEEFRRELLADPKVAMAKMFDVKFPENIKLEVHEESPTVMHLILPAKPVFDSSQELSDNDLKAVTGGYVFVDVTIKDC